MSDRPRCPSCGHPLDQERVANDDDARGMRVGPTWAIWSPCDEGCRHGGQGRYTNAAGTRMRAWADDASIGQLLSEEPGARFEARDRWPVIAPVLLFFGGFEHSTGRVTLCHTCAKEGR